MKNLLYTVLLLLASVSAPGAQLQLNANIPLSGFRHPIQTLKHPIESWRGTSGSGKILLVTAAFAQTMNFGDYISTYRGVVIGNHCELNPVFQSAPCGFVRHNLNVPRFTGTKIVVAAIGAIQVTPLVFGYNNENWNRTWSIINVAGGTVLAVGVVNNAIVLAKE